MATYRQSVFVLVFSLSLASAAHAQVLRIVDNVPGEFTDISRTGTPLNLSGNQEAQINTTIGNLVFAAGRVIVGNNGGMGFDPLDTDLAPDNEPLPSKAAFGGAQGALAFWDNINNVIGDVYWQEINDTLIVQWHNNTFEGSRDTSRFQIKIGELAPGPVTVFAQFIYDDIEQPRAGGGISATIGYQDGAAGFNDVQWSFNVGGSVSNGTVLSLVPEPGSAALLAMGMLVLLRKR